jgi:uncharacterized protein (DUF924 family)
VLPEFFLLSRVSKNPLSISRRGGGARTASTRRWVPSSVIMAGLPGIATPGEVLSFWFQGDLDFNYKTKWFPSGDKDGVGQKAADKEITKRFASTLEAAVSGTLSFPWQENSPETTLALVLVLDQFSRHVWRNDPDRDAKVSVTDSLAVQITISAIEKKWDQNLTPAKLVFLLMPFRHSQKTVRRLKDAINCLDEMLATHQKEHDLLQKFRKTTNRVLQDLEGKGFKDGDEILERREFEPTGDVLETMPNHPVYVSIFKFLTKVLLGVEDSELTAARRRPRPGKDRRNDGASGKVGRAARNEPQETEEAQTDETFRQSEETPREAVVPSVGISLSGGVDSMVLAVVLKKISMDKQSPFGQFQVVAMHVDYANRPESAAEASFVEVHVARFPNPNTLFISNAGDCLDRLRATVRTDYGDCCPYIVQYTPNTGLTLFFSNKRTGRLVWAFRVS